MRNLYHIFLWIHTIHTKNHYIKFKEFMINTIKITLKRNFSIILSFFLISTISVNCATNHDKSFDELYIFVKNSDRAPLSTRQALWQACNKKDITLARRVLAQAPHLITDGGPYEERPHWILIAIDRSVDTSGNYPFPYYSFKDAPKLVQLLIENGANIHEEDYEGNRALGLATKALTQHPDLITEYSEIIAILRSEGATDNELYNREELSKQYQEKRRLENLAWEQEKAEYERKNLEIWTEWTHCTKDVVSVQKGHIVPPSDTLTARLATNKALIFCPYDAAALAAGFIGIAAKVPFNEEVGHQINPHTLCPVCTIALGSDPNNQVNQGRIIQCTCGQSFHASCFDFLLCAIPMQDHPDAPGFKVYFGTGREAHRCPTCEKKLEARISTLITKI